MKTTPRTWIVFTALSLLLAAAVPQAATTKSKGAAKFRTLKKGNFKVKAPKGYKLSKIKDGGYLLKGKKGRVIFTRFNVDKDPKDVATKIKEQLGATETSSKEVKNGVQLKLGRQGGGVDFLKVVSAKSGSKKIVDARIYGSGNKAAVSASFFSSNLLDLLRKVSNSARGGVLLAPPKIQQTQIPVAPEAMQKCTNDDKSATAELPATLAAKCGGKNGAVEAYTDKGSAAFGLGLPIYEVGSPICTVYGCPIEANYQDVPAAVQNLFPAIRNLVKDCTVSDFSLTGVKPVDAPPNYTSMAYHTAEYSICGRPTTAVILAGSTRSAFEPSWILYLSYVEGCTTALCNAVSQLFQQAWASWDPSKAVNDRIDRLNQAAKDSAEVISSVDRYRQQVNERAQENWADYFRYGGGE